MFEFLTADVLTALFQVVLIDLALAGDNAIVIGLAASGLPEAQRGKAVLIGIVAATLLRILFAGVATQILQIRPPFARRRDPVVVGMLEDVARVARCFRGAHRCEGGRCRSQIRGQASENARPGDLVTIVADVSMSLDNVLAVAGAAREHPMVLIFGLVLSIAMMGAAASFFARLLQKHRWIGYAGLIVILYVAVEMTYRGALDVIKVASI